MVTQITGNKNITIGKHWALFGWGDIPLIKLNNLGCLDSPKLKSNEKIVNILSWLNIIVATKRD